MCFLLNCRYRYIIIGNIEELLQTMDAFCFNYQHVVCLDTHFKYRFSGQNVVKSEEGSSIQPPKQRKGQNAQHREKRLLTKKYKKHLLSSYQNTKSTQASGSVFVDKIEQTKKTKFELELIKIVDSFLDGHGN